jgi:hypothetical protein
MLVIVPRTCKGEEIHWLVNAGPDVPEQVVLLQGFRRADQDWHRQKIFIT